MNGVCGLISFNQAENFNLFRKRMEQFLCGTPVHIELTNILTLSVCGGDFFEYIYKDTHIFCVAIGKAENLPLTDGKLSKTIAQLYIKSGKSFTDLISGSFAIIIYDFKKKEFMFFEDEIGSIPLFYTLSNNTFFFSTNINSLFEIPSNKKAFSFLSVNKLLSPALKSGETIYDNIFFLVPGHHIIFNQDEFKTIEPKCSNGYFNTHSLENYTVSSNCNPYCITDITLSPSYALNPFILESARKKQKFTNKMLIDMLFTHNLSFSFEKPFFVNADKIVLFSVLRSELKEKITLSNYNLQCIYDEITNMESFSYLDEKDIERCEIIFLNKRMLIPRLTCDLFSILNFFNIKNESVLNSPSTVNYIISSARYKDVREILSEVFMTDISFHSTNSIPDKFCIILKNLCQNPNLKIFSIFDRFKLFEKAENIEPVLALYILQINYLLENKGVTLGF